MDTLVHIMTYPALFSAYVDYVRIGDILDPYSANLGTGLGLLLYLYFLAPALIIYCAFAWFTPSESCLTSSPEISSIAKVS
jgi:hypothetical protein